MRATFRAARAAFVFLTRLPLGDSSSSAADDAWAPAHFPFVGLVLGCVLAILHSALRRLGALPDATLVIAVSLVLTGALHEDGLADTSDALYGALEHQRVLEILKDSRIGTFGACAVVVSIVGRIVLLGQLGSAAYWALPIVGCAARVAPVWQMIALPHLGGSTAKSRRVQGARMPQALAATAWFVLASAGLVAFRIVSIWRMATLGGLLVMVTLLTGLYYARRMGGVTGDFLGATEQVCELAGYAVVAWAV
jgi:adenosylcobinamide-GDP ribazoletransferase